jgi:hypothetical protein
MNAFLEYLQRLRCRGFEFDADFLAEGDVPPLQEGQAARPYCRANVRIRVHLDIRRLHIAETEIGKRARWVVVNGSRTPPFVQPLDNSGRYEDGRIGTGCMESDNDTVREHIAVVAFEAIEKRNL